MELDKNEMLYSNESDEDPDMTGQCSSSEGETLDQRVQSGPKFTSILKSKGAANNIVNRRLVLAVAKKRFKEQELDDARWKENA